MMTTSIILFVVSAALLVVRLRQRRRIHVKEDIVSNFFAARFASVRDCGRRSDPGSVKKAATF